jgi:hypothetical protein
MPDLKQGIAELKAENKKLKALLKNAVQLLNQSKEYLRHSAKPAAAKTPRKRKTKATAR